MKIEARIFLWLAVACWAFAITYAIWSTHTFDKRMEWGGFVALLLSGGLMAISGSFFWFVSRRIDPRPEDRSDAEIAEAAGELGFFSPGSYWPLGLGLSALIAAIAFAYVQWWLVIIAVLAILFTAGGLLFEYYIGGRRPAPRL
jgi:hypothetical protein